MPRSVAGRAYQTTDGRTGITGPGYGQFSEVLLRGVDANDIIAMRLDNLTPAASTGPSPTPTRRSTASRRSI